MSPVLRLSVMLIRNYTLTTGERHQLSEFVECWSSKSYLLMQESHSLPGLMSYSPSFLYAVMCLVCICAQLPGPGRRAGRGVWNRGAASSPNPNCRPGVCPAARLVTGSHCSRHWGEKWFISGANTAKSKHTIPNLLLFLMRHLVGHRSKSSFFYRSKLILPRLNLIGILLAKMAARLFSRLRRSILMTPPRVLEKYSVAWWVYDSVFDIMWNLLKIRIYAYILECWYADKCFPV